MGSVGYRQIAEVLDGKAEAEELPTAIVRATRVLVRRQRTWLREEEVVQMVNQESCANARSDVRTSLTLPAAPRGRAHEDRRALLHNIDWRCSPSLTWRRLRRS